MKEFFAVNAALDRALLPFCLGRRMQVSFVVEDLDEAMRFWTEKMGVGPFVLLENAMKDRQFTYRGRRTPVEASLAFCYVGDVQIELIAQTNQAPSPYRDFLESGRQGIHHIAFWPDDCDSACKELVRAGFDEVLSIQSPDGGNKVGYYSGPAHFGVMVEIAPMTPDRSTYFAAIKALADTWDGSRPVRRFASRAEFLASKDCKTAASLGKTA
jgi:catechol 2,3-dioxygenase-like lactoylglutathione lyase family enzyme